jgi:hypothetical protein
LLSALLAEMGMEVHSLAKPGAGAISAGLRCAIDAVSQDVLDQKVAKETIVDADVAAKELERLSSLVEVPLQAHGIYFLVSRRWFASWQQWAESPSRFARPGPIDNSELASLARGGCGGKAEEGADMFVALPPEAWQLLQGWYGGGPEFKRRAFTQQCGGVSVALCGLRVFIHRSSDICGEPAFVIEPCTATVGELKSSACAELGLDPNKVRIWDFTLKTLYDYLENSIDKSLESVRLSNDSPILLEEEIDDDCWPYSDPSEMDDQSGSSRYCGELDQLEAARDVDQ